MIIFAKKIIENNQNTPLLSSENYGIIRVQKAGERPTRNKGKRKEKTMTVTEEMMSAMTFGCELEYEGISQATAAKAVAEVTGGTARYEGCHLSNWVVTMPDGRKWQVVSDGS